MDPNIIVSYSSSAGYLASKNEIHAILTKLGDQKSQPELLVPGIIGVATVLKSRDVVEELRDMIINDPDAIKCTLKWVPADNWCDAALDGIKNCIKEEIKDLMVADDQYAIEILPHRTSLKSDEILAAIKPWLKGKISDRPMKILRIELFDKRAAVTLLKPKDIFSRE
jgi:tRNA(Ser,Leu) C12 N-acetylase TAN1